MKASALALCIGISLSASIWVTPSAAAGEPLTLTQAVQRAVLGNVDLRRERVAIQVIDANLMALRGRFDFVLTIDPLFSRRQPPLSDEGLAVGATNTLSLEVGLQRALETGGVLRLGGRSRGVNTSSRLGSDPSLGLVERTLYSTDFTLDFSHPLLRGFGTQITQANIHRQRIQRDVALLNRQMRAANVVRDVIITYWELAYSSQDLAIRRSAVELAQEQLRITKAQIDVGRLAPVDAAAVERAIGERLQEVAVSEERLYFRTLELLSLLGVPPDPALPPFVATDMPSATPREVDARTEVKRALEANPQLRALKTGLRLNEIDIRTAANTLLPRLDFVSGIGTTARRENLGESFERAAAFDELTWSAGLRFELPIQNRTARGQHQAARLESQISRLGVEEFELTLRESVMRLASNQRTASRRMALARQTVGFAQQSLEAERARFQVGRSTNNDVLLRQQELKNAEIQVVRATVDLINSEAALAAATGEILERYGLQLKGI